MVDCSESEPPGRSTTNWKGCRAPISILISTASVIFQAGHLFLMNHSVTCLHRVVVCQICSKSRLSDSRQW